MKATRNVVAHKYDHVDYEIIWNALAHRLPAEASRIREILINHAAEGLGEDKAFEPIADIGGRPADAFTCCLVGQQNPGHRQPGTWWQSIGVWSTPLWLSMT